MPDTEHNAATDPVNAPSAGDDPIFHLALPDDWVAAFAAGEYTMSTRGVTLEQEGFIHCSTSEQMQDTANRFYGDLDQLVVLTIDPLLVPSAIVWESPGPGVDMLFPHIYGPIPIAAVNHAATWHRLHDTEWSTNNL
jgi:glutathione S-transferase